MEQLWAPWRLAYVTKQTHQPEAEGCFICRAGAAPRSADRDNLLLQRRPHCGVLLNRFPYNTGHLLVAPLTHKASLAELTRDEMLAIDESLRDMVEILTAQFNPDGFNIGLNLGRAAGAGLPGHLHWHIVPRWTGDTNFMPVLADVKVMVQTLDSLFDHLLARLSAAPPSNPV